MIRFILKRLLMMIPVLLGVTFIIFGIMYFSPGDPEDMVLGDMATPEDRQMFRDQYGLDEPFLIQYGTYIKNIITEGDFGISYTTKRPVITEIVDRFPTTVKLAGLSVLIAIIIGVGAGIISATRQYSFIDYFSTFFAMIGVSIPNFWQGMMLIILFSVMLGWLPASGFSTPLHWILPAATIGTSAAATIMRMTRSSMLEVLRQDYMRTARSKGQKENIVVWKHALKNALIPVMTIIGLQFGSLLGGTVIIETVFSIPGLGKLLIDAIRANNYPMVQASCLFIAVAMSGVNLIVDVLYAYVDPRIYSQYVRKKPPKIVKTKEVANNA